MPPDRVEGYVWLDVAVNLAPYQSEILTSALSERDRVREFLTPIQVENAERRAGTLVSPSFSRSTTQRRSWFGTGRFMTFPDYIQNARLREAHARAACSI